MPSKLEFRVGSFWYSLHLQWQPTPVLLPGKSNGWRSLVVHGVANSRTRLSDFTFTFHFHALEKEMATHSSVLAWRIPGTGKPGGLPFTGLQRVGHNWSDLAAAAATLYYVVFTQHRQRSEKLNTEYSRIRLVPRQLEGHELQSWWNNF